jgi:putative CocE/NonD family hydrolase
MDWFDRWLKPEPPHAEHTQASSSIPDLPVRIFVMGRNEWRDEREWPLARTRFTPFYLSGVGHANALSGDGELAWKPDARLEADKFTYDPRSPVPTMGGSVCCNPKIFPWGPMDQRPVEKRGDVLVYTSQRLRRELEVTGPVQVVLYVSTSAPDTDFTAKLVDVFPDGEARNLTDGILRLRYRNGLQKAVPAHPGEVYPITIDAGVTSNLFLPGHAVRLEVSSSNFPRFDRNANTGRPVADEKTLRKAQQTIYHGRDRDSHIVLPVIPEPVSDPGPTVNGRPNPREHAAARHRRAA